MFSRKLAWPCRLKCHETWNTTIAHPSEMCYEWIKHGRIRIQLSGNFIIGGRGSRVPEYRGYADLMGTPDRPVMTKDDVLDSTVKSSREYCRGPNKPVQLRIFKRFLVFAISISLFTSVAFGCSSTEPVGDISGLSERSFPIELQDGSDPLDSSAVVSAYIEYFSDARLTPREAIETGNARKITDFCSDLTGQVIRDPQISGAGFTWNVKKPDESAWNSVLLNVRFLDPTVPEKLGERKDSTIPIPWSPDTLETIAVFRSPLCTQSPDVPTAK